MAAVRDHCDQPNCSNAAVVFGFVPDVGKTKTCHEHILTLVNMHLSLFDISAFHFVDSAKDGVLYEERKELVQKGLKAVATLEDNCEREWVTGQDLLQTHSATLFEVFQRTYEVLWRKTKERYEETKRTLSASRSRLERLLQEKDFQLGAEDMVLCETQPTGSPFKLILGDVRVTVADTLLASFFLLPTNQELAGAKLTSNLETVAAQQHRLGKVDIANEVSLYAQERGLVHADYQKEALQYKDTLARRLACLSATEEEFAQLVTSWQSAAHQQVQQGQYKAAARELQRAREALKQKERQHSELFLQLTNTLAETRFQVCKYSKCRSLCEEVLQSWGQHSHAFELWRALFFLTGSLCHLKQQKKALALVEEWSAKLPADSTPCQCVSFYIKGRVLHWEHKAEEAAKQFEAGLELGQQLFPQAYFTALCRMSLGSLHHLTLNQLQQAEEQYLLADSVYSVLCPLSCSACVCLSNLGDLYRSTQRYNSAEEKLQQACSCLQARYQNSLFFAHCLFKLGLLYSDTDHMPEAIAQLEKALPILQRLHSSYADSCEASLRSLRST